MKKLIKQVVRSQISLLRRKDFLFFLESMKINPTIIPEEIIEQMKIEDKQKNDIQQLQFNH